MSEDRAKQLAHLLQALDDCDSNFVEMRMEYKNRREVLINQISALRFCIISGQTELPLEPTEAA